ncbi:hypothetical protein [Desulfovibrio sp. JC010]|uniref:hypothetical protein n=1 Tax=Desulfovibrio sp. JC010 TaxID=2593641 RepID=UPI0013D628DC|nr:hypothetical protein [Desulfovibrio sp. JC010]NDV27252.1 hypothetical protein [Desulfovibrio sp. JC010]
MFVKNLYTYVVFSVLAVSLLCSGPARAFFPSDEGIDETMYRKYGALTSYEAELTFPSEPGTTLVIKRGHDHWQQTFTETGTNATVTAKSVGQYFKTIAQCPPAADMPVSMLQFWAPDDPVADWMEMGMTNATKSYGFFDDIPAFVFGAEQGDDNSPQIWFNNENFAPIRIVLAPQREVRFGTYSKFAGFMLPHTGIMKVGEETLDFNIQWKSIRKKIAPAEFAPVAISKSKGCAVPSGEVFEFLKKCLKPGKEQ